MTRMPTELHGRRVTTTSVVCFYPCYLVIQAAQIPLVRLDPVLIELEREKEDLLIIGHASVIRCMLAYLIGLPVSEIPAIEVARGDLIEVVPASYGVQTQAYHFWDGDGGDGTKSPRTPHKDESNLYENYAEDTKRPQSTLSLNWEPTQIQTSLSEQGLAVHH